MNQLQNRSESADELNAWTAENNRNKKIKEEVEDGEPQNAIKRSIELVSQANILL